MGLGLELELGFAFNIWAACLVCSKFTASLLVTEGNNKMKGNHYSKKYNAITFAISIQVLFITEQSQLILTSVVDIVT